MASHKFQVGEIVNLRPIESRNVPGGAYEVTKQLPHSGREFEYRIKSASEEHERVVGESDLAAVGAADRHLERLREGRPETLETTSLHLDVLRDLKRIHSHICTVAYPVLEAAGEMPAAEVAESDAITLAAPKSTMS